MTSIKKACVVKNSVKNTGKECDIAMVATAMYFACPSGFKMTADDLEDPVAFFMSKIHASASQRVYPLFGQQAPIRKIENSSDGDVTEVLDDGLKIFIRYGLYNRTFSTTSGGLCYANALQGLNKSGYNVIEIDQEGKMLLRKNSDGTYGALITDFMYAPSPDMPDFKTSYKNKFQISYSPVELVNNGVIFEGGEQLLSMMGLIDAVVYSVGGAINTTAAVSADRDLTITDEGDNGDTINYLTAGVPVLKTASESSPTLLAAKWVAAINAATSKNGGYTATNLAGVVTVVAPLSAGNITTNDTPPVTGTIAITKAAFSGGTTAVTDLYLGIKTECAETDLIELFSEQLPVVGNFIVKDKVTKAVITMTGAVIESGILKLTGPLVAGRTYIVTGAAPSVWKAALIEGYDAEQIQTEITV